MEGKNEIMNIMDYEVVDTRSNDIQISGTEVATQLVAVVPNAIAAPFQRYHEVEVKKEIALKHWSIAQKRWSIVQWIVTNFVIQWLSLQE